MPEFSGNSELFLNFLGTKHFPFPKNKDTKKQLKY